MRVVSLLCVAAAFVCVVAALCAAAEEEAGSGGAAAAAAAAGATPLTTKAAKLKKPSRRSLFQACRSDIVSNNCLAAKSATDGTGAGRRRALKGTLRCLEENADKIRDSTCKAWLDARRACERDVTEGNLCAAKDDSAKESWISRSILDDTTKCLLGAEPSKLSKECAASEYYRSLTYQRMWRARRDKNIQANIRKPAPRPVASGGDGDANNSNNNNNNNNNGGLVRPPPRKAAAEEPAPAADSNTNNNSGGGGEEKKTE